MGALLHRRRHGQWRRVARSRVEDDFALRVAGWPRGHTPAAADACEAFLSQVIDVDSHPLSRLVSTTACELAKVLENSYRATIIALMEEWGARRREDRAHGRQLPRGRGRHAPVAVAGVSARGADPRKRRALEPAAQVDLRLVAVSPRVLRPLDGSGSRVAPTLDVELTVKPCAGPRKRQPHDLPAIRRQRQLGLARDQQDVSEAAHRRVVRVGLPPAAAARPARRSRARPIAARARSWQRRYAWYRAHVFTRG